MQAAVKLGGFPIIGWKAVQVDDPSGGPHTLVTRQHDNALVDVGVLTQVDVAGLMAGDDRVDPKPVRQQQSLFLP